MWLNITCGPSDQAERFSNRQQDPHGFNEVIVGVFAAFVNQNFFSKTLRISLCLAAGNPFSAFPGLPTSAVYDTIKVSNHL
ncbi:MAG: hypothetical protein ACOYI7_06585 [Candidatus Excrementavichristensenella sp.]